MNNEERSLTPLVAIYRQNALIKEQEGGYDEHARQHVTDPCGYYPPVSSYITLYRPPRYPIDRHAAGRGNAHAPIRRLAHYRKPSAKAPVIDPGDEAPFLVWGEGSTRRCGA
jgi:hypothetical protein